MKKIALVILCLMVVLTGCSMTKNETSSSQKQSVDPAKQVVENILNATHLSEKIKIHHG